MIWPESEKKRIPEGHYQFRLNREPELIPITVTGNDGVKRKSQRIKVYARGINEQGEFGVIDSFVPWEDRYDDLLTALGVEHGKDIKMEGAVFEADIKHEQSKADPTKVYSRIVNIVVSNDVPPNSDEGDCPF